MRLRSIVVALVAVLISLHSQAAYRVSAWIPPWDSASLTTIEMHAGDLHESNPVWYSLSSSGAIVTNWNAENPTWIAAMTGTQLIPTIQNVVNGSYNASVVEQLIATSASRDAHADELTALVVSKNFDGIDLDYEALPSTARANFTAFVQILAARLDAYGKTLSVTVHPKTSDSQNWNGPGAQDWVALGAAADSIKIMAYDYHWSTSTAGPITPLTWLDQVATYAESTIQPSKIVIGLPWYGYDWQGSRGKGVVYNEAMTLAQNNNATVTRDENGEATFTYSDHTVYFQDGESYSRKIELLKQKHSAIGGFAHWRTGNEDPHFWTVIRSLGSSTAIAPDFSVSGPSALTVRVGKSTSASYSISRMGGFGDAVLVSATKMSPYDAGVSLTPTTLSGSTTTTALKISTTRSTPAGSFSVRVRFAGGSIVKEQIVTVSVTKR